MATFILVPGAGGGTWLWQKLIPELEARGHQAIPVDLPTGDDSAGLTEYADTIVATARDRGPVVLVAQSMAGFSAPLACDRLPVAALVLLNAMVPAPGESASDYWANTGQRRAAAEYAASQGRPAEFDIIQGFFHDMPAEITEEVMARGESPQADKPFEESWPLTAWPNVPVRFVQGREDRLFPLTFQQRVAEERLGITVDDIPGGHLNALSQPVALADQLMKYV
ncbi:MAG TPA: alpha/beta hydrolase [Pseudonocardiaceae bacterium]|jgi:pimeloyl-ACP methyl ester carboxylesterase|nr:alpha/beta hydrolase [Pseudonocardiaceae bacterium]